MFVRFDYNLVWKVSIFYEKKNYQCLYGRKCDLPWKGGTVLSSLQQKSRIGDFKTILFAAFVAWTFVKKFVIINELSIYFIIF